MYLNAPAPFPLFKTASITCLIYTHSLETGQTGLNISTEIYQFSMILHHIPGS